MFGISKTYVQCSSILYSNSCRQFLTATARERESQIEPNRGRESARESQREREPERERAREGHRESQREPQREPQSFVGDVKF